MIFGCRRDRCFTANKRRRSRQRIDPNVGSWTGGAPNSTETVEQTSEAYTQEEITLFFFNIVNERDALAFEFLFLYPERGMCGTVNFLAEKTGGHTVQLEHYSDGRIWGEGCASSSLFNFWARISAATSSVLPNTTL